MLFLYIFMILGMTQSADSTVKKQSQIASKFIIETTHFKILSSIPF